MKYETHVLIFIAILAGLAAYSGLLTEDFLTLIVTNVFAYLTGKVVNNVQGK